MTRLTTVIGDKVYYNGGKYPPTTIVAEMQQEDIRTCMKKLAEYENKEKQTNADRIRNMSDEELAEFIALKVEQGLLFYTPKTTIELEFNNKYDTDIHLHWLKSEVQE